jgi:L-proline amide hydrolase
VTSVPTSTCRAAISAVHEKAREKAVRLSDGYERFVTTFGEGPAALVGLHGGPGGNSKTLLPISALATESLQIVLYDQLGGSGRSARPERDDLWTVERYVFEFEAMVAALGLDAVHLLGHSWGGQLALECAVRCPHLIRSLILCDTFASTKVAIAGYDRLIARHTNLTREELNGTGYNPQDDSEAGLAIRRLFASHWRRSHPFQLERSEREVVEIRREFSDGCRGPTAPYKAMWGENEFSPTGSLRDWDISHRLGQIEVPALIVCGRHDEVVPACSEQIADGLKNAEWMILGQSSHMIFHEVELPSLLATIGSFLARHLL